MTPEQFVAQYESERPMYQAWGEYVRDQIGQKLIEKLGSNSAYDEVVKIPPSVRTKETDSLVNKAFYRNKNYDDPYNDITDKVGIRFVVLLTDQISYICEIIEDHNGWIASKDRDYELERNDNPSTFAYESVHYVVRAAGDQNLPNCIIKDSTPCEIQVRTLLQHAYSEVTHDTVYKSKIAAEPEVHRTIARSMALIDTTDQLLISAKRTLEEASQNIDKWITASKSAFDQMLGPDFDYTFDEKTNWEIAENIVPLIEQYTIEEFLRFLEIKNFIAQHICDRGRQKPIFRQPIVLLVYYASFRKKLHLPRVWNLEGSILVDTYQDLGLGDPFNR